MFMEDVVPVVKVFACFDSTMILSVVVQSYGKKGLRLSEILYFAEQTFY